jgi:predicted transcriptional regulator
MVGIIQIDMHIRDERVFEYVRRRIASGENQIAHETIAEEFRCHRHTAAAIMFRLEQAQLIKVERAGKRGGYIYHLPDTGEHAH